MDVDVEEKRRVVIPRWRDFKTTLALGELRSSAQAPPDDIDDEASLDDQITDWQKHRSLAFATDLVGSGFVIGKSAEIKEAADFILTEESQATALQKRIARQATDPDYCLHLSLSDEGPASSSDEIISHSKERVRTYRGQLTNGLRNPVKLVELSREYAILGSIKKALRTMDVAVALAPANRFVLRSAARLFVHAGEIEKAHYVLKRAPSLRFDPWLLAAEIAVSAMRDQTSSHVGTGIHHINDTNNSPFDVSELTSAIATLEMENANSKVARRLFAKALRKPTENTIAQAEWASRSMTNLSVEVLKYNAPRKYEALAWSHFKEGDLEHALDQGKNWILDQPFAVSPIIFAGMVAALKENYELGEDILRFGLRANPENATLWNNLAFNLASNDLIEPAEAALAKITRTGLTNRDHIVITATEGLIEFRKGFPVVGRALYQRAIDLSVVNNEPGYEMRALLYLAREEINARTGLASPALETAEKASKNFLPNLEMGILLKRLKNAVEADPSFAGALVPEGKRVKRLLPAKGR